MCFKILMFLSDKDLGYKPAVIRYFGNSWLGAWHKGNAFFPPLHFLLIVDTSNEKSSECTLYIQNMTTLKELEAFLPAAFTVNRETYTHD